jgi:hypothetical protein
LPWMIESSSSSRSAARHASSASTPSGVSGDRARLSHSALPRGPRPSGEVLTFPRGVAL